MYIIQHNQHLNAWEVVDTHAKHKKDQVVMRTTEYLDAICFVVKEEAREHHLVKL